LISKIKCMSIKKFLKEVKSLLKEWKANSRNKNRIVIIDISDETSNESSDQIIIEIMN
jgi:hypothetical protein